MEDQEEVLAMTARILKRCGYSVICAPTPDEALRIVERRGANIHLLLTDVVMPGMSGAELAKRASSSCENMRVLFMSGYPDDHLQHRGVLANDVSLIEKPFTAKTLSRTVREVLDRPLSSRLLIRAT